MFAVDSVPAVLAVSHEQFIVFTSNAFAILGLRALYFLLADLQDRFSYLQQGLAVILVFVGVKMIIAELVPHPDVRSRWRSSRGADRLDHRLAEGRRTRPRRTTRTVTPTPSAARSTRAVDDLPTPDRKWAPARAPVAVGSPMGDRRRGHRAGSSTVSIVDIDQPVRRSSSGSGATGSGCARSTPRRRRRSTSTRSWALQVLRLQGRAT